MVQDGDMRNRNFIKSMERGLMVLAHIGASSVPLNLTEIADSCGLNKTATQRFLFTLTSLGYVRRIGKRYSIASRTITLAVNSLNNFTLKNLAVVYIDELSAKYNLTFNLQTLAENQIIILYRRGVNQFLNYDLAIGSTLPVYCTAGGKILLAYLPDDKLQLIIDKIEFKFITENTINSKKRLLQEIKISREKGYSSTEEELAIGHYSLSAAIFDDTNSAIAAITCSSRELKALNETLLTELLSTAETLSRNLNYRGKYPFTK